MGKSGEVRQKVYVEVIALHKKDGTCEPMFVTYKDGRTFRVKHIDFVQKYFPDFRF